MRPTQLDLDAAHLQPCLHVWIYLTINLCWPEGILNPAKPPSDCGKGCSPECNTTCLGRYHEWADYGQGKIGANTSSFLIHGYECLH